MKYLTTLLFISFSISSYACSCIGEQSFCNSISNNSMVCIAESTGNYSDYDYGFRAFEMKLIDLMNGTVLPGNGVFTNTDSIFWIILGSGASCYEEMWLGNAGDRFVMAPSYGDLYTYANTIETGYSLYLCSNDVFRYGNTIIGPIINDLTYYPYFSANLDTISAAQLPQIINDCINCLHSQNLSGTHNYPTIFKAGSTISSSADVNTNVVYNAGYRIRLQNGFKTSQAIRFGAVIDGCN